MTDTKTTGIKEYIENNKERFFDELFSLMRIPSVSAKPEHKEDMQKCAERYAELLLEAGADEAGVFPTEGNPVVFGSKTLDPSYKTVLVYGHYDVQPAEPLEKWNSPRSSLKSTTAQSGEEAPMTTRDRHSCMSRPSSISSGTAS